MLLLVLFGAAEQKVNHSVWPILVTAACLILAVVVVVVARWWNRRSARAFESQQSPESSNED